MTESPRRAQLEILREAERVRHTLSRLRIEEERVRARGTVATHRAAGMEVARELARRDAAAMQQVRAEEQAETVARQARAASARADTARRRRDARAAVDAERRTQVAAVKGDAEAARLLIQRERAVTHAIAARQHDAVLQQRRTVTARSPIRSGSSAGGDMPGSDLQQRQLELAMLRSAETTLRDRLASSRIQAAAATSRLEDLKRPHPPASPRREK
jgi:hypothetical protein